MPLFRTCFAIAVLFFGFVSNADARIVREIGYDELFAKSDLVVIARPLTKTTDTGERSYFPDVTRTDAGGRQSRIPSVGVETAFEIAWVIKGRPVGGRFVLHHYREEHSPRLEADGMMLVSFDPSDPRSLRDTLLFLTKEPDGRYAPYGGQTDPGLRSIRALDTP